MPNHIINRIRGSQAVISRLLGQSDDGKLCVDFARIIEPPPEIVKESFGLHVKDAAEIALGLIDFATPPRVPGEALVSDGAQAAIGELHRANCLRQLLEGPMVKDFSDADFELFVRCIRSYRKCGVMDWYDWNIANWGTKWNAYSTKQISDNEITFETAWSAPHPVIEKMHDVYPADFRHEWSDEDIGSNVGFRQYCADGSFDGDDDLSNTKAGFELAFELHPESRAVYVLDGDTYRYREDEV